MIEYEDDPNDWEADEEEIIVSEDEIKQLRQYCKKIESILSDIYDIIGN